MLTGENHLKYKRVPMRLSLDMVINKTLEWSFEGLYVEGEANLMEIIERSLVSS